MIITWKIPLYPPFAKGDLSGQNYFHAFVVPRFRENGVWTPAAVYPREGRNLSDMVLTYYEFIQCGTFTKCIISKMRCHIDQREISLLKRKYFHDR